MLRERSSTTCFVDSTLDIAFQNVKCPDSISLILICLFLRKCTCKSHLFLKFEVLREGSSFIASIVEHPVYSNFKMCIVLILILLMLIGYTGFDNWRTSCNVCTTTFTGVRIILNMRTLARTLIFAL